MSTVIAHIEKETILAPKLRFKGYTDDWEKISLGDCITLLTDYHANGSYEKLKENVELLEEENYAVMIRTTNFEKKDYSNNLNFISEHAYNYLKKSKVFADDIIINKIANAGATYIMPELNRPVSLAMNLFLLRVNNVNSPKYIYSQIKTKEHLLRSLASGTGTKTITKDDVRRFEIEVPALSEQQKIASFLSAVDEKMQQLTRKKELLEQYKKGVMQQLFSGKLRFKDDNGKAFPKWEEKRLGDVSVVKMGQSPDSKSYNTDSVGMLLIQGNADINGRVTNPRQWTSEPTKICEIGDLILTVRAPVGSISKSLHHACLGRGVCAIKNTKNSNIEFLYQFLLGYEDKWKKIEQGSTFTAVNGNEINSLKLNIPTLPEQKKIANYLSSIDSKIEIVNNQIAQTQTFKKGLLQQMFV